MEAITLLFGYKDLLQLVLSNRAGLCSFEYLFLRDSIDQNFLIFSLTFNSYGLGALFLCLQCAFLQLNLQINWIELRNRSAMGPILTISILIFLCILKVFLKSLILDSMLQITVLT